MNDSGCLLVFSVMGSIRYIRQLFVDPFSIWNLLAAIFFVTVSLGMILETQLDAFFDPQDEPEAEDEKLSAKLSDTE